jgi:hypothetical protein
LSSNPAMSAAELNRVHGTSSAGGAVLDRGHVTALRRPLQRRVSQNGPGRPPPPSALRRWPRSTVSRRRCRLLLRCASLPSGTFLAPLPLAKHYRSTPQSETTSPKLESTSNTEVPRGLRAAAQRQHGGPWTTRPDDDRFEALKQSPSQFTPVAAFRSRPL